MRGQVDMSHLAQRMLEWEQKRRELDDLEAIIQASVLSLGKTQVVGNVRATFSAGRKQYDYEAGASTWAGDPWAFETAKADNTKEVTDWRWVCQALGIDESNIPFKQGEPSVKLKLSE